MTDPSNALVHLSSSLSGLVARIAPAVVAVGGQQRRTLSGLVWRASVVVTAEEALETDEGLFVLTPDGRRLDATLAGRDPSTNIAVLRFAGEGVATLSAGGTPETAVGSLAITVGRRAEGAIAQMGPVSVSAGAWQSLRGGRIDRLLHLDQRIEPRSEGAAVADAQGRLIGMLVAGPRRAALVIPTATIERVAERLLTHGRIGRGYLGLGMQAVHLDEGLRQALALTNARGVMVIGVDAKGPAKAAGLLQGDVITAWNGNPVASVREIMRQLGPEAIGQQADVTLVRAGALVQASLTIAERPTA